MVRIVSDISLANYVTHSGTMHADEVFATAFLDLYRGDINLYRTNSVSSEKLDLSVIVYDVGRGKFDHHQNDALKRDNGITYCSFGLLWKEFGRDFLRKYDIELIEEVWAGIDKDLVEGIDADDNGIFPKIESNYKVKTVPGIIKLFNPSFDSGQIESEQFLKAVDVARSILQEEILYINGKCMANMEVKKIVDEIDVSDKYLILDRFLPYEETILNDDRAKNILFVAYPSNRGGYVIKVVPKSLTDSSARCDFPLQWAGLEGEELEKVSGIKDLVFCHTGRFIVSCSSIEAVYSVLDFIC